MSNGSSNINTGDLWSDTSWFAIQVKPRRETFASLNVSALDLEVLSPRVKVDRLVRGTVQPGTKPLFPGYFFARFCPKEALETVKTTRGVLRIVTSGRFPIPVPDDIIRGIQERIQEDGLIRIKPRVLARGTLVTIQSGPFEGMMGRVERELDDRKRVVIFLETLFQARVLIERRWIEAEAA